MKSSGKISIEWDKGTGLIEANTEGTTTDITKALLQFIEAFTETAVPKGKTQELRRLICSVIRGMPMDGGVIEEFSRINLSAFQKAMGKEGEK